MWNKVVILMGLVAVATAQIPSLGWCPDYQPMAKFDMNRFLGQWHEAERYFSLSEVGSRCVTTNYEKMPDGRVWVSNEIRNSFTGVKRVVEGQLQVIGRDGEGKLSVKYTSLPVPYEGQYLILDTDYKSFAVMWSCSGAGPIHAQNAWILTRERLAPGAILQRAYGILDKLKISRAFFVQTNQEDCTVQPAPLDSVDPTPDPTPVEAEEDLKSKNVDGPVVPTVEAVVVQEKIEKKVEKVVEEVKPAVAVKSVPELIHASAEQIPSSDKKEKVVEPIIEDKIEEVKKDIVELEKLAEPLEIIEKVKEEIKPAKVVADEVQQIVPEKVEPVIEKIDPVPEKVESENKVESKKVE